MSAWRERAEDASQVTASLGSERSVVQNAVVAEGSGAFHLANPGWQDESVALKCTVLATAATKVFFESKLAWADPDQVAKLQVSTNGGGSWTTLWSRAGTGSAGQGGFELVTVSLAAYAGMSVDVRFFYNLEGQYAYTGTSSAEGWFIDDIQIGESFIKRPYEGTGDPTADEIQMLEFINRARADAVAEAARLRATTDTNVRSAINYFAVDLDLMQSQFAALTRTTQPLAMNAKLLAAARLHSQDMFNNVFQGHYSSTNPPSPNLPGDALANRVLRQGYIYSSIAENVYSYAKSAWHCHAAFNIDWGGSVATGGMQSPAGHRNNIHNASLREIGIGAVWGTKTAGSTTVGPLLVTHDIGVGSGGGQPLITGVTYADADGDNFYDPGEGVGGIRVDVEGTSYYAVSSTHGAYAVPVSTNGVYPVTFQRAGYAPVRGTVTVAGGLNAKADYRGQSLRVDSLSPTSSNSVRMVAAAGQAVSSVTVRATTNFVTWTNVSPTRTDLPGGLIQIDATLPGATNRAFFKVETTWAAP